MRTTHAVKRIKHAGGAQEGFFGKGLRRRADSGEAGEMGSIQPCDGLGEGRSRQRGRTCKGPEVGARLGHRRKRRKAGRLPPAERGRGEQGARLQTGGPRRAGLRRADLAILPVGSWFAHVDLTGWRKWGPLRPSPGSPAFKDQHRLHLTGPHLPPDHCLAL